MSGNNTEPLKYRQEYQLLATVVQEMLQHLKDKPFAPLPSDKQKLFFLDDQKNLQELQGILNGTDESRLNRFIESRDSLLLAMNELAPAPDEVTAPQLVSYRARSLGRLKSPTNADTASAERLRGKILDLIRGSKPYDLKDFGNAIINSLSDKKFNKIKDIIKKITNPDNKSRQFDLLGYKDSDLISTLASQISIVPSSPNRVDTRRAAILLTLMSESRIKYITANVSKEGGVSSLLGLKKDARINGAEVARLRRNAQNARISIKEPLSWISYSAVNAWFWIREAYINRLYATADETIARSIRKSIGDAETVSNAQMAGAYLWALTKYTANSLWLLPVVAITQAVQLGINVALVPFAALYSVAMTIRGVLGNNQDWFFRDEKNKYIEDDPGYAIKSVLKNIGKVPYFVLWKPVFNAYQAIWSSPRASIRFMNNGVLELLNDDPMMPKLGDESDISISRAHRIARGYLLKNSIKASSDPILNFYTWNYDKNKFGYTNTFGIKGTKILPPSILEALRQYIISAEKNIRAYTFDDSSGPILLGDVVALNAKIAIERRSTNLTNLTSIQKKSLEELSSIFTIKPNLEDNTAKVTVDDNNTPIFDKNTIPSTSMLVSAVDSPEPIPVTNIKSSNIEPVQPSTAEANFNREEQSYSNSAPERNADEITRAQEQTTSSEALQQQPSIGRSRADATTYHIKPSVISQENAESVVSKQATTAKSIESRSPSLAESDATLIRVPIEESSIGTTRRSLNVGEIAGINKDNTLIVTAKLSKHPDFSGGDVLKQIKEKTKAREGFLAGYELEDISKGGRENRSAFIFWHVYDFAELKITAGGVEVGRIKIDKLDGVLSININLNDKDSKIKLAKDFASFVSEFVVPSTPNDARRRASSYGARRTTYGAARSTSNTNTKVRAVRALTVTGLDSKQIAELTTYITEGKLSLKTVYDPDKNQPSLKQPSTLREKRFMDKDKKNKPS